MMDAPADFDLFYVDELDELDMGPDGQCGAAGSEWCDWECPRRRLI